MGTSLERLVPCMSGSSKRTLRVPTCFHSDSTCSTETDFFSAIAMPSTPAPVVPHVDFQAELRRESGRGAGPVMRQDREHSALAPVATQKRCCDHARRLQVVAVPA